MKEEQKAFHTPRINHLQLKFPNGNALSTMWGAGSYTENHDFGFEEPYSVEKHQKARETPKDSNTVEVMPTCSELVKKLLDAKFPDNENGLIFTYLTFPQWLEIVNILNENK